MEILAKKVGHNGYHVEGVGFKLFSGGSNEVGLGRVEGGVSSSPLDVSRC